LFADRLTVFLDASVLASALKRNLLLTLAEAEFFRVRWSQPVLSEAERAIEGILRKRGLADAGERAARARRAIEAAFENASVDDFGASLSVGKWLPDPEDAHVVAAAVKARAAIIVTDNLRHFPALILVPLGIEARSADAFIADTIDLDVGRAVAAVKRMRERFKKPEKTADLLILDMEAAGLLESADLLRPHVRSL
jgi:predicted nucleic acid-binding protein